MLSLKVSSTGTRIAVWSHPVFIVDVGHLIPVLSSSEIGHLNCFVIKNLAALLWQFDLALGKNHQMSVPNVGKTS